MLERYQAVVDRLAGLLGERQELSRAIVEEFRQLEFPTEIAAGLICLIKHEKKLDKGSLGLAVLSGMVASGQLSLYHGDELAEHKRFLAVARVLSVPPQVARVLYRGFVAERAHELPRAPRESPIGRYLAVRGGGFTSSRTIAARSLGELVVNTRLTVREAIRLQDGAIRSGFTASLADLASIGNRREAHVCCPPFTDPRWDSRFDYFGPDSRLSALITAMKTVIAQQIRQIYASHMPPSIRTTWAAYRLGDATLNTLRGRAEQRLEDLSTKTTKAEVDDWLTNIRDQLAVIKTKFKVVGVWTYIETGVEGGMVSTGGGDGDSVHLYLQNEYGSTLMDVAPPDVGWGYDDGEIAFEQWEGDEVAELAKDPLEIRRISFRYTSDNPWLFEKANIDIWYDVNEYSFPITSGIVGYADRIHDDQEPGWVNEDDAFDFNIVGSSRLAILQGDVARLESALNLIEAQVTLADSDNWFVANGDALLAFFAEGARSTRQGEYAAARAQYLQALARLEPRAMDGELEKELVFALHALVADTYLGDGSPHFAYSELRRAWDYLSAGDNDARDYLWLRLAEVFLRWGDQLYAAAGGDYAARLLALPYYRKVYDECMRLTYPDDGAEDEVADLWIDLGRTDGALPPVAERRRWVDALCVHTATSASADAVGIVELDSGGTIDLPNATLPVIGWEVAGARTGQPFLRIRLSVRETELLRTDLDLVLATTAEALRTWLPECVRVQVRYARYNPSFDALSPLAGTSRDVESFKRELGNPLFAVDARYWRIALGAGACHGPATVCRASGCIAELLQARATVRRDQIRAHLNIYGIHDEYVPNGRFQSLNRMSQGLAERAAYFSNRYTEFLLRGETAVLEEMDGSAIAEIARENVVAAELRVEQAQVAEQAAHEGVATAGFAFQQSQHILNSFSDSQEPWLLRHLSNVQVGFPWSVSVNVGGALGTLTGEDGYDEAFATQEMQYRSAVEQAEANVHAAQFRERLAEIEVLLSAQLLRIERIQQAHADERLAFLRMRALSSTYWYETARIYRTLSESHLLLAARWAWLAERALEYEINVAVDLTRMDYHLLPLGADRLVADLERQRTKLAEFREQYRDIPNIIEREFRFSNDFPEQFRALTSSADAAPAERLGHGVRAVEFRTAMQLYDERLHGRYAFGRVLGVEVELQTDVSPGVFTGHLENARVMTMEDQGVAHRYQLSSSLVRVPRPMERTEDDACRPAYGLDDSAPCSADEDDGGGCLFPDPDVFEIDPLSWSPELQWILDHLLPVLPRLQGADWHVGGGDPEPFARIRKRFGIEISAQNRGFWPGRMKKPTERMRALVRGLRPLVQTLWRATTRRRVSPRIRDKAIDPRAASLLKRGRAAGLMASSLMYFARELAPEISRPRDPAEYRALLLARRLKQARRFTRSAIGHPLVMDPDDIAEALELRKTGARTPADLFRSALQRELSDRRSRSWSPYELRMVESLKRFSRDRSAAVGGVLSSALGTVPDYIDYSASDIEYVLLVKQHDAESLSLSNFTRREDALVYNPYNSSDQLGVFENTGIDSWWRLTLRALPANRLNRTPQWDKIRDVIFRVWYHAAYERNEGFRLAEVVEPQAIRLAARKTLEVSFYADLYDEFRSIVGDYDVLDPTSLDAMRGFSDATHAATDGWIAFPIDASLVPEPGQRISAAALLFTTAEPSTFPNYRWSLRYGLAGPVFTGTAVGASLSDLADAMSRVPPNGFRGLDPEATWHFRLRQSDNAGLSLAPIRDIRFILELAPI